MLKKTYDKKTSSIQEVYLPQIDQIKRSLSNKKGLHLEHGSYQNLIQNINVADKVQNQKKIVQYIPNNLNQIYFKNNQLDKNNYLKKPPQQLELEQQLNDLIKTQKQKKINLKNDQFNIIKDYKPNDDNDESSYYQSKQTSQNALSILKQQNLLNQKKEFKKIPIKFNNKTPNQTKKGISQINQNQHSQKNIQIQPQHIITTNDFEFIQVVGKGGFGKVWQIKCIFDKKTYALKEISKLLIIDKNSVKSVLNERNILAQINSKQFLYQQFYCKYDLCILNRFTFIFSNEFYERRRSQISFDDQKQIFIKNYKFNIKQKEFFIACLIIALQHIQQNEIIHRDIKPENLVIDSKGYLRLTDFGIARKLRKDNGIDTSGTPGYMAPEVLMHQNHSYTVDYFALGILTYELMLGRRPYYGKNRQEIKEKILQNKFLLKPQDLPIAYSESVIDFVNSLLIIDQQQRLGAKGIQEIKNHPWFNDFDWKSLEKGEYKSPFLIDLENKNFRLETSFCHDDSQSQNKNEIKNILKLKNQEFFKNYDFLVKDHKLNPFISQY